MKKFLCYDTNDAVSGKVNVSANGMLKPDIVFYVNVNTLVDADGNHITYEQAKEAGLNCVIVLDASSLTVGKPTIFSDQGDYIEYYMDGDKFSTFYEDPGSAPI